MTRPQGRGDASRRRGCKLFRHSVAGSNATEYDALANVARTLLHVAPDGTELASGVQVLDGLPPHLRRNARREHDCRCDYDSLHDRDAV